MNDLEAKLRNAIAKNKSGTILHRVLGIFFLIMTAAGVATTVEGKQDNVGIGIFMTALFAALTAAEGYNIYKCQKTKEALDNYTDFSARLSADPERSIEKLARTQNIPTSKAVSQIRIMLKAGLFPNGYIDHEKLALVISEHDVFTKEYVSVKCPSCGATNKIPKGSVSSCEYCGSPVSLERSCREPGFRKESS